MFENIIGGSNFGPKTSIQTIGLLLLVVTDYSVRCAHFSTLDSSLIGSTY